MGTRELGLLVILLTAGCQGPGDTPRQVQALGASDAVVISQIYSGGGNSGATYTNDYVELLNRTSQAVTIGGWSVQYGSAASNFSQKVDIPAGTSIAAGQYYLVRLSGGATGTSLPTADLVGSFNMGASAGKVALVKNTTQLACGAAANRCTASTISDLVGYGSAASDYEGAAPAPAPGSNTNAALRGAGGCTDAGSNTADFSSAAATPRNSASTTNNCSALVDAGAPDLPPPDAAAPDAGAAPVVPVVISQIYGGGGNSSAAYTNDYVELFNRSTLAVSIAGWSVQYGSAANNFSQKVDIPTGTTIAPGRYFLIQLSGGATGSSLPTPDLTASFNMSGSAGKIALVNSTTQLACGSSSSPCSGAALVDLVGYGSSASAYEGSASAPAAGSNANAVLRKNGGCTDTNDNAADFSSAAATPRNSASTANNCSALVDAGVPDLPPPDTAVPDAATPDAATPDAATPDAATPDAATPDAQAIDAPPTPDTTIVVDAPVIDAQAIDAQAIDAQAIDAQAIDAQAIDAQAIDASPTPDTTPVVDVAVDASTPAGKLVVISQVYSAGGNSGATYNNDFVELFNRDTQTAPVGGWSVQYGTAAGDITQQVDIPAGTSIAPGKYFLVQLSGGMNGASLPTADLLGSFNMSGSAGKVALVKSTTPLACGATASPCSSSDIVDLLGYGSSASYAEGSPAPASSSAAKALFRDNGGCTDTDDNAADFSALAVTPRNSASPQNNCGVLDGGPPSDLAQGDQAPGSDLASLDTFVPSQDLAGSDAGHDSGTTSPSGDGGGCACSTHSARSGLEGLFSLGLAALLLALVRRRQRRPPTARSPQIS